MRARNDDSRLFDRRELELKLKKPETQRYGLWLNADDDSIQGNFESRRRGVGMKAETPDFEVIVGRLERLAS
jgi:hypothetical protein